MSSSPHSSSCSVCDKPISPRSRRALVLTDPWRSSSTVESIHEACRQTHILFCVSAALPPPRPDILPEECERLMAAIPVLLRKRPDGVWVADSREVVPLVEAAFPRALMPAGAWPHDEWRWSLLHCSESGPDGITFPPVYFRAQKPPRAARRR